MTSIEGVISPGFGLYRKPAVAPVVLRNRAKLNITQLLCCHAFGPSPFSIAKPTYQIIDFETAAVDAGTCCEDL